jgi:hypothetical protein
MSAQGTVDGCCDRDVTKVVLPVRSREFCTKRSGVLEWGVGSGEWGGEGTTLCWRLHCHRPIILFHDTDTAWPELTSSRDDTTSNGMRQKLSTMLHSVQHLVPYELRREWTGTSPKPKHFLTDYRNAKLPADGKKISFIFRVLSYETFREVISFRHQLYGKVWGSGCRDPRFLDLGTSWRWVVNFPPGKSHRYLLDRRPGGRQSRSGRVDFWPCRDSNSKPVASCYTDCAVTSSAVGIRNECVLMHNDGDLYPTKETDPDSNTLYSKTLKIICNIFAGYFTTLSVRQMNAELARTWKKAMLPRYCSNNCS